MMQIAVEMLGLAPQPPRLAPISAPGADFEQMIARFVASNPDTPQPVQADPPLPLPVLDLPLERQDLAGYESSAEPEPAPIEPDDEQDPAVEPIWLPPVLVPVTREPQAALKLSASPIALIVDAAQVEPARAVDQVQPTTEPEAESPAEAGPTKPDAERAPPAEARSAQIKPSIAITLPPAAPVMPSFGALQTVAQLLAASHVSEPAKPDTVDAPTPAPEPVAPTSGPASPGMRVEASAPSQDAPLDMGRGDWIETMIERIDTLREESGDRAAQIRLRPDALGAIDVRIRQQGEQVHIHFVAETAAVRSLLTDAAPRLAELAEARGLRLGDTGVGQGFAGRGQDQRPHVDPRAPNRAPRPTLSTRIDRSAERIA